MRFGGCETDGWDPMNGLSLSDWPSLLNRTGSDFTNPALHTHTGTTTDDIYTTPFSPVNTPPLSPRVPMAACAGRGRRGRGP